MTDTTDKLAQALRALSDKWRAQGNTIGPSTGHMARECCAFDLDGVLATHDSAQGARIIEDFVAWQCEKCGRYHHKHFPEEGCDWCSGEAISKRLGLRASAAPTKETP